MSEEQVELEAVEDDSYPPDMDGDDSAPIPHAHAVRQAALARKQNVATPARKSKRNRPVTQSKILAKEKQRTALELRKGGASYDAIAKALGYADPSGARKAIERGLKQVIQEPALEVKTIQIERCNHMLLTLWPQVQAGDGSAINTALRVMQQLDNYMGTNTAQQVDVNVHHDGGVLVIDGNKDDYIIAMKKMSGIDSSGNNIPPALPAPVQDDTIEGEVIEADWVDSDPEPLPEPPAAVQEQREGSLPEPVSSGVGPKPAFNFGMDPELYRKG